MLMITGHCKWWLLFAGSLWRYVACVRRDVWATSTQLYRTSACFLFQLAVYSHTNLKSKDDKQMANACNGLKGHW